MNHEAISHSGAEGSCLLRLENARFVRILGWEPDAGLRTVSLYDKESHTEYALAASACEFLIEINGKTLFGYKKEAVHLVDGEAQRSGLRAELRSVEQTAVQLKICLYLPEVDAEITVFYELLEDQPAMRKWLQVKAGRQPLVLGKFYFEALNAAPGKASELECFIRHGLTRAERMFVTNGSDDILQAHDTEHGKGYFLANSAPGPLNRFLVYPQWSDTAVLVGYNGDTAPFRKYLDAGEAFVSHRALLMLYAGKAHDAGVRNRFRACLRTELPPAMPDRLMYCTWIPFLKNINESLLIELADSAAAINASTFVVDDGWFEEGGWCVNRDKFPNGLEPVADKVRSLGMRFGLWFNIGTDYGIERMFPDDNAQDIVGNYKTNGFVPRSAVKCLASAHRERVLAQLIDLVTRYQVGYFKLDFSSIISPYGLLSLGCHSQDHRHHRDGADALYEQYASLFYLREQLKARFPDLILDFSFESFGTDFPNLAALQSSELHHSSNLNTRDREEWSARTIRNVLYRFNTVLPMERIMGSLICLQSEDAVENLLTALMGAPLVAGDIRGLSDPVRRQIRCLLDRIEEIEKGGPLSHLIKLQGDRYIGSGDWDGYCRFNDAGEGFIALFRNETTGDPCLRLELIGDAPVQLVDAESGEVIDAFTSAELCAGISIPWQAGQNYRCLMMEIVPLAG